MKHRNPLQARVRVVKVEPAGDCGYLVSMQAEPGPNAPDLDGNDPANSYADHHPHGNLCFLFNKPNQSPPDVDQVFAAFFFPETD